jgi:hypothetical protein
MLSGQHARFDERPDALLEEKGIALRPNGQPGLERLQTRVAPKEGIQ